MPHLYKALADQLERSIRSGALKDLPTIGELARQWRVSYPTMWKAIQELSHKGLVVSWQGKRSTLSSAVSPDGTAHDSFSVKSADQLFEIVKRRISDGMYAVGNPFPKFQYFVLTESVSHSTVTKTFVRLAKEDLAHKRGKTWVAGPDPTAGGPPGGDRARRAPVVAVMVEQESRWSLWFSDGFHNDFMLSLRNEVNRHGHQLVPIAREPDPHGYSAIPVGIDQAKARIKSLGDRHAGTLIVCIEPVRERLSEWIPMFAAFDKPLVLFDSAGWAPMFTRRSVFKSGGTFYRLYLDERTAIAKALNELASRGHRTLGVHGADIFPSWGLPRLKLIQEEAARISPDIRIVPSGPSEQYFQKFRGQDVLHQVVSTIAQKTDGVAPEDEAATEAVRRGFRDFVMREIPSFVTMLRDGFPTALIALNDRMAREQYFLLKTLGIEVPRDMSIVSFDDTPESVLLQISTMSFGFDRLGYLAAHAFIGDIPIQADRYGGIPGECRLLDRGSLAAPGDVRRLRSLLR